MPPIQVMGTWWAHTGPHSPHEDPDSTAQNSSRLPQLAGPPTRAIWASLRHPLWLPRTQGLEPGLLHMVEAGGQALSTTSLLPGGAEPWGRGHLRGKGTMERLAEGMGPHKPLEDRCC